MLLCAKLPRSPLLGKLPIIGSVGSSDQVGLKDGRPENPCSTLAGPGNQAYSARSRLVSAACGEGCGKAGSDQLRLTSVPKAACLTPQKCDFKVSGVRVLLPIYRATHLPHQAPRLYSSNATCLNSKPQLQGGICWQGHACAKSLTMAAQAAGARQSALKALTVIELLGQVRSPGETCPE